MTRILLFRRLLISPPHCKLSFINGNFTQCGGHVFLRNREVQMLADSAFCVTCGVQINIVVNEEWHRRKLRKLLSIRESKPLYYHLLHGVQGHVTSAA